jgi:pilus assembly protein CpaB
MRAVTVGVGNISGVNGFVFPGDRVDIVLTQEVSGEGPPLRVSETIFRNVRVLATDRRIAPRDANGNQVPQSTSTVTLEATPRMAERIMVAQTIGQLSLALRSLADNQAELEQAIASGSVRVPEGGEAERRMLRTVANQPSDTGATYSVGGDVSRFQRRTLPPRPGEANKNAVREMQQMMREMADRSPRNGTGNSPAPAAPTGPVVRVTRGNNVTVVPVGAR